MAVNFGPSYIEKYDVQGGVHSISELQPMNPEDRQVSSQRELYARDSSIVLYNRNTIKLSQKNDGSIKVEIV